jgi:hemoglobin/transferrin/lactoferrin receptor protein
MTLPRKTLPALHCAAFCLLATPSQAQAPIDPDAREKLEQKTQELDTVEVRGERLAPDVPDRLQRGQARTVRDLFDLDARVNIGGGTRNGQRLYLRGVEGSNLNVTVDGARQGQNLYNHRGGLANVDPEILKRVDLDPGPVAADAGYGALGGSIRFTTVDAQDRLAGAERLGAAIKSGYASAADSRRVSATAFGLAGESLGLLVHATAQTFDDLRTGGGVEVPFSGGEDRSVLAKFSLIDVGGHSLRLGVERNEASGLNFMQRGDYPWQLQPVDFRARPPQDQDLVRNATTFNYRYAPAGDLIDLRWSAAKTRDDFFAPNSNGERFISRGRNLDLRNVSRWGVGSIDGNLTYGLEWVEQEGTAEQNSGVRFFRTGNDNLGAFLQSRIRSEQWDLGFGGRSDRYEADYGVRRSSGRESSLNLSGQWRFGDGLRVHGGYGEAIRGFGTIPLQFTRNIAPTLTFNGRADGDLRPERGRQTEFGIAWEGQGVLGADQVEIGLKRYLTRLQDVILFDQPGSGGLGGRPVRGFSNNASTVRFEGTELTARWATERLDSALSLIDAESRNLNLQPQFLARTGAPVQGKLVWDSKLTLTDDWTLGYTFTAVEGLDAAPAGQEVYIARPGYSLHDLQLTWRAPARQWGIAVAINNIFDRRYSNLTTFTQAGFSTDEAGRDLRLSVDYHF